MKWPACLLLGLVLHDLGVPLAITMLISGLFAYITPNF